jgi:hypothetical protein
MPIPDHFTPLAPFRILTRTAASLSELPNLDVVIRQNLTGLALPPERLSGRRIAVTAGSRGIASIKEIVRAVCQWLRDQGAQPFVIPAMGSHGGATAEGQRRILEEYGICQDAVGAEILSSMETVCLGETQNGFRAFMDRCAWEADGVLVMNRVKPHTDFTGKIESGRLKMIAVGLGKRQGAEEVHRWARKYGYETVIREVSERILASGKILGGLAVVENETHRICQVRAARPEELVAQEEETLALARQLVPRLPFSRVQLLVVDEMGKNISGTGMDTKIIGRGVELPAGEAPAINLIYVRDLTPESGGNAVGMGNADLVHEHFYRKVDLQRTYINAQTSLKPGSVRLPMYLPSDQAALNFALRSLGSPGPEEQRVAWIHNTLDLSRIAISESLASEAANLPRWQLSPEIFQPCFDAEGNFATEPLHNGGCS